MQLGNVLGGVPLSIWYDWKNDGPDEREMEHNFGIVDAELAPKPAFRALKHMTALLGGFRVKARLPAGGSGNYVVLWENERREQVITAWTTDEDNRVQLPQDLVARVRRVADMYGEEDGATLHPDGLQLTVRPVYLSLDRSP
jgi:hypothetical protein